MIVLPVNINDQLPDLFDHRMSHRQPVDRNRRSARGKKLSVNYDLFARLDRLIQQRADLFRDVRLVYLEKPRDPCMVNPGTDHVTCGPQPKQHLERADHQALARAGLTGKDIKPSRELDLRVFDDRQIQDM